MNFVRVSNAWKISLFSKKGEKKKTIFDIEEICRISMMKKKKKEASFEECDRSKDKGGILFRGGKFLF